jgi:perosamine synthetase
MIPVFKPMTNPAWTARVAAQIDSGYVGPGRATTEFEGRFAQMSGVHCCIATTSGTMALWLAIRSLELSRGSTVLFPAYGMAAGANAAAMLDLNVRLVDIDEETLCMDPQSDSLGDASAMIAIAVNGNWNGCEGFASGAGIPCIMDACQALGCQHKWLSDLVCYSFSPQKLITTGQGGLIGSNDYEKLRGAIELRDHGGDWRAIRIHHRIGLNLRFDDIKAAYAMAQLDSLEELVAKRREIRKAYRSHIPIVGGDDGWCVIYRTGRAKELMAHLHERGVESMQPYKPNRLNASSRTEEIFPNAERAARELVYLPSHLHLRQSDVDYICEAIREFK